MNFPPVNNHSVYFVTPNLPLTVQIALINRGRRWLLAGRLAQLGINSHCPQDGSIWVEVQNPLQAFLVRSVVLQMVASRNEQIDWLEHCWGSEIVTPYF